MWTRPRPPVCAALPVSARPAPDSRLQAGPRQGRASAEGAALAGRVTRAQGHGAVWTRATFAITCSGDVPLPFLLKDRFKEKGFDCISSAHADFAKPGVPF